jgi:thiol-disulfide isomerase/thioredoxin
MLLTTLAVASLLTAPTPAPVIATNPVEDHGKIDWFKGSFEEALAQAKASNKIIFIDFWTTWCGWCKRMDKDTFSDDTVAAEMKDIICLSIDAESKTGKPVAERFHIKGYPALLLLASDGTTEDSIGGYLPPDRFKLEIQRVRAGRGTAGDLKRQVEADRASIEKRFALAQKLQDLGDQAGYDAQMAEIKKIDPDGKSLAMHRIAFDEAMAKITVAWQRSKQLDTAIMVAFVQKETYPELLFKGYTSLAQMHTYLAKQAEDAGDAAKKSGEQAEARAAMKNAWKNVPENQVVDYGNSVAWAFYEDRDTLQPADKAFALEVAEKVLAAAKDNVNAIDTYACCLYMNGKKDEARKAIARCIEIEPNNENWKERLDEFQK